MDADIPPESAWKLALLVKDKLADLHLDIPADQQDPVLKGAIRKNLLTERVDNVKPLGWYQDSPTLTDVDIKYTGCRNGDCQ